jgi:hypothetical protein
VTDDAAIHNAFDLLRDTCDPRGLELLEALESLCLTEKKALDAILTAVADSREDEDADANVVPMIQPYSVKV